MREKPTIVCAHCGTSFVGHNAVPSYTPKVCSLRCAALLKPKPKTIYDRRCEYCRKAFQTDQRTQRFCCAECGYSARRIGCIDPQGYRRVRISGQRPKLEHRLVAEQMIGRKLSPDEVVHHIDGDRANNDPSNLQVMTASEHNRLTAAVRHQANRVDSKGRFRS